MSHRYPKQDEKQSVQVRSRSGQGASAGGRPRGAIVIRMRRVRLHEAAAAARPGSWGRDTSHGADPGCDRSPLSCFRISYLCRIPVIVLAPQLFRLMSGSPANGLILRCLARRPRRMRGIHDRSFVRLRQVRKSPRFGVQRRSAKPPTISRPATAFRHSPRAHGRASPRSSLALRALAAQAKATVRSYGRL